MGNCELKLSASCLAIVGLACWSPASAQSDENSPAVDAAQPAGLEEIVVTAQKREESLQDAPISIAVLSGSDLQTKGLESLGDFASGVIPSMRVVPSGGYRSSGLSVTMRGINPGDTFQVSRDPTVGIYLDGVYLGRAQGLNTEMFDLERMEVLRGPQGTLFGRNAVAGAISFVSRRPTGEFGADVAFGVGNLDNREVKAHINLPEIAGISVKIDGIWRKRDGWVNNSLGGQRDWNEIDRRGLRVSALWQPVDDLELLYSFDISRDAGTTGYPQLGYFLPDAPPLPPIFSLEPRPVDVGRAGVELRPSVGKVQGHSLHASWTVNDNLTVRSITAYRKVDQNQFDNSGALLTAFTPNGVFSRMSYAEVDQDQFSQELQLVGTFERLNFVLGGFYFEEDATDLAFDEFTARFNATGTDYTLLPVVLGGPRYPARASAIKAKSKALFGQFTYTPPVLDDRLHLTAGLRWTDDEKTGGLTALRGVPVDLPLEFTSDRIDPAASVAFDVTDDINTYVRWGRAYRAGGANARSATFAPFGEEELESWELGAKAQMLDNRLRLNVAAYRIDYRDRQVNFVNPANPSNNETLNAPGSTIIKGVEVELTALPAKGLMLTGSYAYTHSKAPIDTNPFTGVEQPFAITYTPSHSASGAIDYEFAPFDFGTVTAHVDAIYSGSFLTGGIEHPATGPYFLLNGRLTLGDVELGTSGNRISFSLWGKNLTQERYEVFQFGLGGRGLSNIGTVVWNEPRTYGFEFRFQY